MIPTFQQVADHCRSTYLGDTEISGGQLWKDVNLLKSSGSFPAIPMGAGPIAAAYETMVRAMLLSDHRALYRFGYFDLPAYTSMVLPSSIGITNLGSPIDIWDRKTGNQVVGGEFATVTLQSPVPGNPGYLTITTSSPHPFTTGKYIVLYSFKGLSDDINDMWISQCPDTSTIIISGAQPTGTWTTGSGVISSSEEDWPAYPLSSVDDIQSLGVNATASLEQWAYSNGYIRFKPTTQPRQIRVKYQISSRCPADITASTCVDGCLNFLSTYAAAAAIGSKGMQAGAERLFVQAVGNPTGVVGKGDLGHLGDLLREDIKGQTMQRIIAARFRPKRNTGTAIRYAVDHLFDKFPELSFNNSRSEVLKDY